MKKMIKSVFAVITVICASASFSPVYAQRGYTPVERRAVDKALAVIEDYETTSSLSDDDAYDSFVSLFVNDSVEVYNDLLGLSDVSTLKVKDYADRQRENARSSQVFVSDIKRESLWQDGSNWKVQFAFDKTISYTNKCGVYFSSNEFYGVKHHLHAVLVYDSERNVCKIERINGKIDSDRKLPENFYTLLSGGEMGKGLKYKGKSIQYNSYGQAYLTAPVTKGQFSYSDADVVATPKIDEDCKVVSMSYSARKWAVKAHYDMGLGTPYKIGDGNYKESKSSSSSFGLDLGYIIPSKSKFKIGIFAGVAMAQSKLDLSYEPGNFSYSAPTTADVNGLTYNRYYQNVKLSQNYKLSDFMVPVYLDFDMHFSKFVSFYVDLGVKAVINTAHKIDATEGSAYIYGIYPQFDNLRMDEHWGFNGFGNHTFTGSDLDNSDIDGYSSFTLDGFGGAGLRIGVPKVPVYLDLGVSYQMGFMNLVKNDVQRTLSGSPTYETAMMYNTVSGTTSTEHVRNLVEGASSIKRNRLSFNIGLIFKF